MAGNERSRTLGSYSLSGHLGNNTVIPIVKWAGGKRWLAPGIAALISASRTRRRIVEPFAGSGAVTFCVEPARAVWADSNEDLISTYDALREDPLAVARRLARLKLNKSTFDRVRAQVPRSSAQRAVRLLYLNRA